MSEQNWRTEVEAVDYFTHAKKAAQLTERRPVTRASDLVGPGIGATTIRITDYRDLLATFNGYYSSEPGAFDAPNSSESFVGHVISDAVLGGRQVFTGLTSGNVYSRSFTRSPTDPETIGWDVWQGGRIPATIDGYAISYTTVGTTAAEALVGPLGTSIGPTDVFEVAEAGLLVRKQGVYTGHIRVGSNSTGIVGDISFLRPAGSTSVRVEYAGVDLSGSVLIPFTVWAFDGEQGFSVRVRQTVATADFWWQYQCTRLGDAI